MWPSDWSLWCFLSSQVCNLPAIQDHLKVLPWVLLIINAVGCCASEDSLGQFCPHFAEVTSTRGRMLEYEQSTKKLDGYKANLFSFCTWNFFINLLIKKNQSMKPVFAHFSLTGFIFCSVPYNRCYPVSVMMRCWFLLFSGISVTGIY